MGEGLLPIFSINQERDAAELMITRLAFAARFRARHLPEHPDPRHCAGRKGVPGYQAAGKTQPGCRPYWNLPHRRNQRFHLI